MDGSRREPAGEPAALEAVLQLDNVGPCPGYYYFPTASYSFRWSVSFPKLGCRYV
ncbi:protein of unknown function [Candidatus Methylacidiphilum fumarolicum]|uniref:Uncharacterized protein n=1 Tax=Candidatus Methylacidiphilum fumarolicum TaxID=591154 RepID=A0ABM9IEG5_9BACT|nr:protein of unknown function [Candidatus Methylacidiphilum fumarolicum]